jgi:N-acetylglucosamine kinase-like BadF-type ATPase
MDAPSGAAYAVDAGGSCTAVRVRRRDGRQSSWQAASCAIATVGEQQAVARLRDTLSRVRSEILGDCGAWGCLASSSFPVAGEAPAPDALIRAIISSGCPGRVLVVNDVVPLLWSGHLAGHGVVVNSGTGSVVFGRSADGRVRKLGGHEHILSDQGSAYALAREGLRAATRAGDGLGPATQLLARAEAFYGRALPALGRWLAELDRARFEVARFAPQVLEAEQAGDEVACCLVRAEVDALVAVAASAVARLGLGDQPRVGLSGGVMRRSPRFRGLVVAALERTGLRPEWAVLDSVAATLDFVDLVREQGTDMLAAVGGMHLDLD